MKTRSLLFATILVATCAVLAGCASRVPREIIYAALGASDAVGVGAVPLKKGYVWRIRDALDRQVEDVRLLNLGIPAADARGIEDVVVLGLRSGLQPDLVTMWTGVNDIIAGENVDQFESRLERILDRLRNETSATIVIADIPDLTQAPRFVEEPSVFVTTTRVESFNQAIHRQAKKFDVPVVPISEASVASECVSDVDGFHPNNAGHQRIADLFLRTILPELGLAN